MARVMGFSGEKRPRPVPVMSPAAVQVSTSCKYAFSARTSAKPEAASVRTPDCCASVCRASTPVVCETVFALLPLWPEA